VLSASSVCIQRTALSAATAAKVFWQSHDDTPGRSDLRRAIATKWPGNRLLVTSLGQPAARRCDLVGVWARQPEVNGLRLRGSHPIG
jgi:hypothetical protein